MFHWLLISSLYGMGLEWLGLQFTWLQEGLFAVAVRLLVSIGFAQNAVLGVHRFFYTGGLLCRAWVDHPIRQELKRWDLV